MITSKRTRHVKNDTILSRRVGMKWTQTQNFFQEKTFSLFTMTHIFVLMFENHGPTMGTERAV